MAMYKNREVYIANVVEQAQPAKVFVVAVGDPDANREIVNKSDVVVFDKSEVPEAKVELDKDGKKVEDWRTGYAVPTEDQKKIHENNLKLRQAQAEKKDEIVSFKPAKDSDLKPNTVTQSTPVVKQTPVVKTPYRAN